jgi:hypothetical protein
VATTKVATNTRQPANTVFIRANNLPWREDPAAPSMLVLAIMLVTRADPTTSPWGDYVGNASRSFNTDGRRFCLGGSGFPMTNNRRTQGRLYFWWIVGFLSDIIGFSNILPDLD